MSVSYKFINAHDIAVDSNMSKVVLKGNTRRFLGKNCYLSISNVLVNQLNQIN